MRNLEKYERQRLEEGRRRPLRCDLFATYIEKYWPKGWVCVRLFKVTSCVEMHRKHLKGEPMVPEDVWEEYEFCPKLKPNHVENLIGYSDTQDWFVYHNAKRVMRYKTANIHSQYGVTVADFFEREEAQYVILDGKVRKVKELRGK
jgi:hypothetical protein